MLILVDNREQLPYSFSQFDVETECCALPVGDYSVSGFEDLISVERKSLDDLVGCLSHDRERFKRELQKGKHYDHFFVVVEATLDDLMQGKFHSQMNPKAALQSVVAFQVRYRTHFIWAGNRGCGEIVTFSLCQKFLREIEERYKQTQKGKKRCQAQAELISTRTPCFNNCGDRLNLHGNTG